MMELYQIARELMFQILFYQSLLSPIKIRAI
jgi:hypothetical protein